jgi:hypothetical protein
MEVGRIGGCAGSRKLDWSDWSGEAPRDVCGVPKFTHSL